MLYVFYVDLARRLTFDMNLVNGSVRELKKVIEEDIDIPVHRQVLLISGGDCLKDTNRVCNYPAGTDTNPIYLFNRDYLDRKERPSIMVDYRYPLSVENELNHAYDSIVNRNVPVSFNTIYRINSLAQKYLELAMEMKSYCDSLNNDQFLQQQGLAAGIANLDDVLGNFKTRCESFDKAYNRYLGKRKEYIQIIDRCIDEDLKLLSKIPLLPALVDGNEEEKMRLAKCCDISKKSDVTLLNWISSKEPGQSLENFVKECKNSILRYDNRALDSLKGDVHKLFRPDRLGTLHNNSNSSDISEKLMTLAGLIVTIKDTYEDQFKNASGIKRNLDRLNELKEDCVLVDLLETHRNTIKVMKANHQNMKSCRQLCIQTKKDLCDIIHSRLIEIMLIQEGAAEIQNMINLHNDFLRRTSTRMDIIHQIRATPKNYFAAVSEVVRRRSYSQAFLMWASDLACRIFTIYTEETERRKRFMSEFKGHFLKSLFPGLQDMPPAFATQTPPLFDNNLPALCDDDLKFLRQNVPDLEERVELPNVEAVRNFFLSRSLTLSEGAHHHEEQEDQMGRNIMDDDIAEIMSEAGADNLPSLSERFDHLPQKMITSSDSFADMKCDEGQEGQNESSKVVAQINHEKDMETMRDSIAVLGTLAHTTVMSLRNDLTELRSWASSQQSELAFMVKSLSEKGQLQRTQIDELLQTIKSKDEDLMVLLKKVASLNKEKSELASSEKQLRESFEIEREKIVREVTEQLTQSHRQEIEALRQRFKLMASTNMERCLSETSLEKAERTSVIELGKHELIVSQVKLNMEIEAKDLIEKERAEFKKTLDELTAKCEADKLAVEENVRRTLFKEFKKEIDQMRSRESSLVATLERHKATIHTLASPGGSSNCLISRVEQLENEKRDLETELLRERQMMYSTTPPSQSTSISMNRSSMSLMSRIEQLEKDKRDLETELTKERQMTCSSSYLPSQFASFPVNSGDIAECSTSHGLTSLELPSKNKTRHRDRAAYKKSRKVPSLVSVQSCKAGDLVLVVWDETLKNYTILQESKECHFIHPSSYRLLNLPTAADGPPKTMFFTAIVIDKEYCAPKKTKNRYNVKEGERFYRVKLKPLEIDATRSVSEDDVLFLSNTKSMF